MKHLLLFCVFIINAFHITAQQRDKQTLLKLYERCASIKQGHYTITERKKNFTNDDTVLTRKKVYFINAVNSNLTPPYTAKIIDLNSAKIIYVDSGGVEVTYNAADSTQITRPVNSFNHVFDYFMPYVNRTNIMYLNEYPERMGNVSVEENVTSYIITNTTQQADVNMGQIEATSQVFFNKQTLVPEKIISKTAMNGMSQYSEKLISEYDFSAIGFDQVLIPKYLPIKKTEADPLANRSAGATPFSLSEGQPFPAMKLPLHNGSVYNIVADSAKLYILDFWYISCAPCILLSNTLKNLQHKYATAPVRILGINPKDSTAAVQNWIKKRDINYPSCVQAKSFASSIGIGQSFPIVVLLDEKRKVLKVIEGYSEDIEAQLDKQLQEVLR